MYNVDSYGNQTVAYRAVAKRRFFTTLIWPTATYNIRFRKVRLLRDIAEHSLGVCTESYKILRQVKLVGSIEKISG